MTSACYLWNVILIGFSLTNSVSALKTKQLKSGETLRLRCSTNSVENTDVIWNVPGNLSDKRYEIVASTLREDKSWFYKRNIKVTNVTVLDNGYYTCLYKNVNNSAGDTAIEASYSSKRNWIKRVYVYVYDPSNLLLKSPVALYVEREADLVLPCRASHGKARVNITRVPEGKLDWSRINHDPTLGFVVKNITHYDNGFWKCEATYNAKTKVHLFMVNVAESTAPKNPLGEVDVFAVPSSTIQNHSVEISCGIPVDSGVRVKFEWLKFPSGLVTNKKIEYWYENNVENFRPLETQKHARIAWSKLTLTKANLNDTGIYTCEVTYNKIKKAGSMYLVVYAAPSYKVLSEPWSNISNCPDQTLCVAKGRMADLSFQIKAVPSPYYEWYNGSKKMIYSSQSNKRRLEIDGSVFRIFQTTRFDSGNYTLKIISPHEIRHEKVQLLVQDPQAPRILKSSTDLKVDERIAILGQDIQFFCNATGLPVPNITWFHEDKKLPESSPILKIQRVKLEDKGNYTCRVKNSFGMDAQTIFLTIAKTYNPVLIATLGIIFVTVFLLVTISWMNIKRKRKVKQLQRKLILQQMHLVPIIDPNEMALEEQAQCLSYDPKKWEFPRDRLRFGKTLGRGAFGKVVQATAFDLEKTSSCKTVAVKMLKVGSRSSEYNALMSELKILIHLGPHLNIVNLLGACTSKDGPLMILVEYCRHGNLSVYLRGMRDYYVGSGLVTEKDCKSDLKTRRKSDDSVDDGAFFDDVDQQSWVKTGTSRTSSGSDADTIGSNECDGTGNAAFSREYEDSAMSTRTQSESSVDDEKEKKERKKSLSLPDLLSYSLQVSRGMEFLASKKCIHRDLAARNILLSDYQVVKICDFGLARDVYKDPDYVRAGDARLPLKWMAPESIFDKVYTTKSDVWSFGVLLWEIFTLGGSPYPGLQIDEDFCHKLRRGVRMSKPRYATDAVYSAMLACWANFPEERPDFTKLCEELSDVLQTEAGHEYLDLMKLFDADVEGKLPLRGVKPQQIPDETFEENLSATPEKKISVTYTDVEAGVLHNLANRAASSFKSDEETFINENQESFDSVIETTQDSITFDQLTSHSGYLSEDSGMDGEKQHSTEKKCLVASPCEPPPLYDDVIALRNQNAA